MQRLNALLPLVVLAAFSSAVPVGAGQVEPQAVRFATADGGEIHGLLNGTGSHAVVLAHGAVFDKESWTPLARRLAAAGLTVLAIDFRGYGSSREGSQGKALELDMLAAVEFLAGRGAGRVSAVGGSMGGGAVATAAVGGEATLHRVILLAAPPVAAPERLEADSLLFVVSRGERLRPVVEEQFARAPEPKRLELLDGEAHAQHVFNTVEGDRLEDLIVAFLVEEPEE